jgi:hypothetical protein
MRVKLRLEALAFCFESKEDVLRVKANETPLQCREAG